MWQIKIFFKEIATIFSPVDNKKKVADDAEIVEALKKNNRIAVKKYVEESEVNRNNLILLVRKNIGDLSTSMIKDLEQMLGVELMVENE